MNCPEIPSFLRWVWDAYVLLSNARTSSYTGPNPIALAEIRAYCDLTKLKNQEDIEDLIFLVQSLDHCYFKIFAKSIKSSSSSQARQVSN